MTPAALSGKIAAFRPRRPAINSTTAALERPQASSASGTRVLIIHNPISGRRSSLLGDVRGRLEAAGCAVELRETARPDHAREIAAAVSHADYDRIVVSGGDGTINEAINGITSEAPPVAIIPRGTANVLAAEIGLGADPRQIADTIVHGTPRTVSLGIINGRKFLLMAGVGFDASVVATVSSRLKRAIGKGAYVVASLRQMIRGDFPRFEVLIDGAAHAAASVVIANAHYYGGRYVCAPEARLESPVLQVCLFERGNRFYVAVYGLALVLGLLPRAPGYRILPATTVEIRRPDGAAIQADGDFVGHTPARATVLPRAVRLVFPRS